MTSLVSGKNGKGGRGQVKFTPTKNGAEKVLAMLKGGHKTFRGSLITEA